MPLFSLRNVIFRNIIHYPDIEIPEGCVTFICGESGCGKSTLLKLLNGVISADEGEILYASKPIEWYDPIALRREVLLCGQSPFLFDENIQENFAEYYKYRDLLPISQEKVHTYLKICAADVPLDAPCITMSGGERQRVFTAICLSFHPSVLLLDEPTSSLDDATADMMMKNIKTFCQEENITLIVVSHNKLLAQSYADYTISLAGGSWCE
ncbi:MAG: energy-coupling factor ABC transporter ATP-binding protein [Euryarchaeota archaeon]|nr:energy-coupling factor ABC transporter ATP-binding protein [Euryarchaeota archaeon]